MTFNNEREEYLQALANSFEKYVQNFLSDDDFKMLQIITSDKSNKEKKQLLDQIEYHPFKAKNKLIRITNQINKSVFNPFNFDFKRLDSRLEKIEKFIEKSQPIIKEANKKIERFTDEQIKLLSQKVTDISWNSNRIVNICRQNELFTLLDVFNITKLGFERLRNSGGQSIKEIDAYFKSKGLDWDYAANV
jgi:cell division protein ZapA (FtsZ GTPase activity inhibitor)